MFDVLVIGAGPAGLFAAFQCAAKGMSVCLLEAEKTAGKKLLITGQGKCNITNSLPVSEFVNRYGGQRAARFVKKSLFAFSNSDLVDFFSSQGLTLKEREDGKIFPASERSADALNLLLRLCTKSDVCIVYNRRVSSASKIKSNAKACFGIETLCREHYQSENIIIATGGFTYPTTGSNGDGYNIAESFGHNIVPPRPSLAAAVVSEKDFKAFCSCAGISAECSLKADGIKKPFNGNLLFTHQGLSGPVIIDNSRDFSGGSQLRINLFPGYSADSLEQAMVEFCRCHGKNMIKSFFTGSDGKPRLPSRLVEAVFNSAEIAPVLNQRAADLSAMNRRKIINSFTELPLRIKSLEGRSKAMCTAGGVDISQIDSATMESRLVRGLYFAGEVIDIDGDSGGFNLQFAFSSAAAAAAGAAKSQGR